MKNFFTLLVALVITVSTFAQAPEKMSYQAVVRDSGDALVTNQAVGMQISILQVSDLSNPNPTIAYSETHTPTTNANGLVSIAIGTGSVVSGDFTTIDWSIGTYFIKTETDPTGGASYTITGTSQLLSVPFALQAKNGIPAGGAVGQVLRINNNGIPEWVDIDGDDFDGDGFTIAEGDCNDNDASAYPGATDIYGDGLDNDCDGDIDEVEIGDIREGGVVFWVDPTDNTHGLVCALSDYGSKVRWGCLGTDLTSVPNVPYNDGGIPVGFGAEIGDGSTNTDGILSVTDCPTAPAALAARSYGSEWFLPSINELNEMYIHKDILEDVDGVTLFRTDNYYWSSTEIGNRGGLGQNFNNGNQDYVFKNYTYYVRAVRAF